MKRRALLAGGTLALSGCLGRSGGSKKRQASDLPPDEDPDDGYPPRFDQTPARREVDPTAFGTVDRNGFEVPLVPIDVAYYWYRRRAARFADARGRTQYERSHIYGAVLSPALVGDGPDPVADWPKDDRIVCYCGCPHHLSSIRAANLLEDGYENVFVIDEGFWEWHERGYPMAGTEIASRPVAYLVRGRTDPAFAGETAWAWHEPTGQREATAIDGRGAYEFELRFFDVSPASTVLVRTPGYSVRASLSDLTTGIVTAPDA